MCSLQTKSAAEACLRDTLRRLHDAGFKPDCLRCEGDTYTVLPGESPEDVASKIIATNADVTVKFGRAWFVYMPDVGEDCIADVSDSEDKWNTVFGKRPDYWADNAGPSA